jgi:hypothetical protein
MIMENHVESRDAAPTPDAREDYSAPKLTDLGTFEELTQFTTGPNPDSEGTS